ncbi:hypothetical protein EVAR_80515_1 [Eumeta japonica]|uniref:Uncharacterized protein n=1 Tax=Eumeta variegata TaxID=151549 RepID=A0A4C1TMM7_EUMVA|nr:hypothetical protein EVAR_80515_1 [Eumeta japonica]
MRPNSMRICRFITEILWSASIFIIKPWLLCRTKVFVKTNHTSPNSNMSFNYRIIHLPEIPLTSEDESYVPKLEEVMLFSLQNSYGHLSAPLLDEDE